MAKLSVSCPDRQGLYGGFYSAAGFFPVGTTEVELDDDTADMLRGEIARGESILTVVEVPAPKGKR